MSAEAWAFATSILTGILALALGLYNYRAKMSEATEEVGSGFTALLRAYKAELELLKTRVQSLEAELHRTRDELKASEHRIRVLEAENTLLKAQLQAAGIPPLETRQVRPGSDD